MIDNSELDSFLVANNFAIVVANNAKLARKIHCEEEVSKALLEWNRFSDKKKYDAVTTINVEGSHGTWMVTRYNVRPKKGKRGSDDVSERETYSCTCPVYIEQKRLCHHIIEARISEMEQRNANFIITQDKKVVSVRVTTGVVVYVPEHIILMKMPSIDFAVAQLADAFYEMLKQGGGLLLCRKFLIEHVSFSRQARLVTGATLSGTRMMKKICEVKEILDIYSETELEDFSE